MRTTKVLVCAAALAAGIVASIAQSNVYSLNVVGYYNVTVGPGQKVMLANQLNTTNNVLTGLIPNGPPDAYAFQWDNVQHKFHLLEYDDVDNVWENGDVSDMAMAPGQGIFYFSPTATTLTFVGEVLQSPTLTVQLPIGANAKVMVSSIVPQAGTMEALGLGNPLDPNGAVGVAEPDDQVFLWDPTLNSGQGGYAGYTFDDVDYVWENGPPAEPPNPSLAVGQAFFYIKAGGSVSSLWVRNFSVQ